MHGLICDKLNLTIIIFVWNRQFYLDAKIIYIVLKGTIFQLQLIICDIFTILFYL